MTPTSGPSQTTDTAPTSGDAPSQTADSNKRLAAAKSQLDDLEKELLELIRRKKQVDKNLANLEVTIYNFEGSYLQDSPHGNIVRGFDQFLQGRGAASTGLRRQHLANGRIAESERIFSHSSTTYRRALGLADDDDELGSVCTSARPASPSSGDERPIKGRPTTAGPPTHRRRRSRALVGSGDELDNYEATTPRLPKRIKLSLGTRRNSVDSEEELEV